MYIHMYSYDILASWRTSKGSLTSEAPTHADSRAIHDSLAVQIV